MKKKRTVGYVKSITNLPFTMPDCPICFDKLRTNLCTTECGHMFHRKCLRGWALSTTNNVKCPSCNKGIKGMINLYVDFSTDDTVKVDSKLEKKVARLRAKNDAVNEMQVKLDACNELNMQLMNEHLKYLRKIEVAKKGMERAIKYLKKIEVANKRVEDMKLELTFIN